ncbi:unnamed protein product [Amoebophrya sp. A120]|nr:unnamed protein product [Amoebophrya sp. A120]|eukprot:GSA120T00015808001.1
MSAKCCGGAVKPAGVEAEKPKLKAEPKRKQKAKPGRGRKTKGKCGSGGDKGVVVDMDTTENHDFSIAPTGYDDVNDEAALDQPLLRDETDDDEDSGSTTGSSDDQVQLDVAACSGSSCLNNEGEAAGPHDDWPEVKKQNVSAHIMCGLNSSPLEVECDTESAAPFSDCDDSSSSMAATECEQEDYEQAVLCASAVAEAKGFSDYARVSKRLLK